MIRKTQTKVAACLAQQAAPKYDSHVEAYRKPAPLSSGNLRDQIGLLLWFLCSPLSRRQSAAGWKLLEVLLSQSYQESAQSTRGGRSAPPELTNTGQRVS